MRRDTHLSFDEYYCLYINDLLSLKVCLVVSFFLTQLSDECRFDNETVRTVSHFNETRVLTPATPHSFFSSALHHISSSEQL